MADDDRTTAFGVWRFGRDYLKAAHTLDDADTNAWVASNVTHQCVCQGIELAFKSYVLAKGKTLNDLRSIGHSLVKCMNAAVDLGLPKPSAEYRAALDMIDRYYKDHEFRYIVTGMKEYPALGALLAVCAKTLYDAAPDVASAMGEPKMVGRMRLDLSADFGLTPSE